MHSLPASFFVTMTCHQQNSSRPSSANHDLQRSHDLRTSNLVAPIATLHWTNVRLEHTLVAHFAHWKSAAARTRNVPNHQSHTRNAGQCIRSNAFERSRLSIQMEIPHNVIGLCKKLFGPSNCPKRRSGGESHIYYFQGCCDSNVSSVRPKI